MAALRKRTRLAAMLAALTLLALPALAAAHAFPESSDPAPGENLQRPPHVVTITFDEELDPDGSHFSVLHTGRGVVGRGTVDLTVADRNVLRGDVEVHGSGLFVVRWTALSIDGDTTRGSFTFGVQSSATVPSDAPQEESPDTALSPPVSPAPLSMMGVALILLALVAVRRGAT
jgi:methionine-rich copper-binding protein CopC